MTNDPSTQIEDYMRQPYEIRVKVDRDLENTYYIAFHPELEGCSSQGFTWEDAVKTLRSARRDYFIALIKEGMEIPKSKARIDPPGTIRLIAQAVRLPEAANELARVKVEIGGNKKSIDIHKAAGAK